MNMVIALFLIFSSTAFAAIEVVTEKVDVEAWTKVLQESEIEVDDSWSDTKNPNRKVKLKDGLFDFKGEDGHELTVTLEQPKLFLRSGAKVFAIAVYGTRSGGSGYWQVMKRYRIAPRPYLEVQSWPPFPDREPIESLKFEEGQLIVVKVKHAKDDALCCATESETLKFKLKN